MRNSDKRKICTFQCEKPDKRAYDFGGAFSLFVPRDSLGHGILFAGAYYIRFVADSAGIVPENRDIS